MDIPVQNVYFLLCYAWNKLEERDIADVDPIGITELVDLFARVLVNGTNHLLKRGLDRSYVVHEERTSRLKGKIQFASMAKAGTRIASLPCEFDELSFDVLHNQILKATIRRLVRADKLSRNSAEALAGVWRHMMEVRDIELTGRLFGQVQLHRNNRFYDFLIKVCELVYWNLLVSEAPGRSRFRDFTRDPKQMARLYEEFVRNFYDIHSRFDVKRENIYWSWIPADSLSKSLLPQMQTDVSLSAADRKIIIDCKYTPEATKLHYEADRLRSSHLYQLHAYLANLPPSESDCEGMLLYPTVEHMVTATYMHQGHRIQIRTINLNQPWQLIHEDLLKLVA